MSRLSKTIRTFTHRIALTALIPLLTAAPVAAEEAATVAQAPSIPQSHDSSSPATPVYEFAAGERYVVKAALLHVTDIALQAGEEILGQIAGGDTARWMIAVDTSNRTQHHVFVKPIRSGLATNMIVRTNRRTYLLDLSSGPADAPFMVTVGWTYPDGTRAQSGPSAGRSGATGVSLARAGAPLIER